MVPKLDMIGFQRHYLTVTAEAPSRNGKSRWICRCVCGAEVEVQGDELTRTTRKGQQSCGCMKPELIGNAQRTHGRTNSPLYWVWRSMKARCRNPRHKAWANYGGRGITVCERWLSFDDFYADVSPSYVPGTELDRTDNGRGYAPDNFRWVSRQENANNTRKNTVIDTPQGRMTVSNAARAYKIGVTTLLYRIANRWPESDLFIPAGFRQRGKRDA